MLTVACEETNVAGLLGPYLLVFKTNVATVASHTRFQSSICYITICFLKTCLGKLTCCTIFWQKLVLHGNKVWPRFNFTRYLVNETHRYGALVVSEISKKKFNTWVCNKYLQGDTITKTYMEKTFSISLYVVCISGFDTVSCTKAVLSQIDQARWTASLSS